MVPAIRPVMMMLVPLFRGTVVRRLSPVTANSLLMLPSPVPIVVRPMVMLLKLIVAMRDVFSPVVVTVRTFAFALTLKIALLVPIALLRHRMYTYAALRKLSLKVRFGLTERMLLLLVGWVGLYVGVV